MLLKKSPIVLCSSSNLPTFVWPSISTTSSCSPLRPAQPAHTIPSPRPQRCPLSSCTRNRGYATVSDKFPKRPETSVSHHDWPSGAHPTPYQIFDQKRDAPYSKARFYTLVKIYHPDRHTQPGAADSSLSHAVRLERYRLVVAANQILSDPARKRAYDLYGAGWGSKLSMDNSMYRNAEKSWRNEPGNPSMNATWEDWERWYGERDGEKSKQRTVFMSNELFVVVICAFVVAGSMGQAKRANKSTMSLVEMHDQKHEAISHDIRRRQTEQYGLTRHERVESFLRQREGWNIPVHPTPRETNDK